ncbi:MFS-type transporter involved in bile tolerance (Atg22 family) [Planifilum fimeticola]|uniref:MFS-type transporter involved in bile tolerance (Atg22 family) n=1 Tax=Planifilum fimeticola TaxID=201975 RepID=A0A2T0LCB1_9BACL|nr:MFS transporter [Planifilum fimeticola]PRX39617.1 MFS-type transporter involved in bile tolerance (Atg22 family) [Planifilum fimeticola]
MCEYWRLLKREKPFRLLVGAGFIGGVGSYFFNVAVLGHLLQITGTPLAVGFTLALRVLPYLLFGSLAGWMADKIPRKRIMIAADLLRALLALSLVAISSPDHVWIIYAVTFAIAICNAFHTPASNASVPLLVKEKHLLVANALDQTVLGSVLVVGSVSGGIISAAWGTDIAFVLNACAFFTSALMTGKIVYPPPEGEGRPRAVASSQEGKSAWREIAAFIAASRLLRILLAFAILVPLADGILNVLISVYAFQVFDMGNTGTGILYGALGTGLMLGGALAQRLSKNIRTTIAAALFAEGFCRMLASQSTAFPIAVFLFVLVATAAGIGNACTETLIMRVVPSDRLGRVYGFLSSLQNGVFGAALMGAGALPKLDSPAHPRAGWRCLFRSDSPDRRHHAGEEPIHGREGKNVGRHGRKLEKDGCILIQNAMRPGRRPDRRRSRPRFFSTN